MTAWTSNELTKISTPEELELAFRRRDGTLRRPVTIWKDVSFVDADSGINDELDAAYRAKYRRYAASIIRHITSPEARAATIELVPRSTDPSFDQPVRSQEPNEPTTQE